MKTVVRDLTTAGTSDLSLSLSLLLLVSAGQLETREQRSKVDGIQRHF